MFKLIPKRYRLLTWKQRMLLTVSVSSLFVFGYCTMLAQTREETAPLNVSASFAKKESVSPVEIIELHLSRPLEVSEGALAVFINQTDITSLFNSSERKLRYSSQSLPLPAGENSLTVYLVLPDSSWKEIAQFPLRVKDSNARDEQLSGPKSTNGKSHKYGFDTFEIKPSLTVNLLAQSTLLFFPTANRPDRINSTDLTFQS
ncbi:MAG: hypothetical protein ACRD8U_20205, partial [Pyrinomonadaceae bacterium]